jgi:RNA recognition motif-containing protein
MSQAPIAVVISEKGDWNDGQVVPINISHDSDYATAVCMAYESSPGAVFETAADISTALSSIGEGPKEDTHNIGLLGRLPATKRIIPVSRSIWVSNLSSETTHLDLEKLFEGYSRIIRAYISHGDQGQSYCYGFVVLDSRRDAFQARKWRHGSFLNGRRIACQLVTGSYEYVLKEGEEGVILGSHIASVAAARQGISWKGTSRFHSVSDFQNRHLTSEEIKGKVSNNALSLPQEIPSPSGGHGKYLEWLAEQGEKGEAEHYFRRNKSLRIDNIPLEVNRIDLEKIFAGFSRRPTKGYIARNPEGNSLGYGYVVLDRTRQSQRCRLVTRTFSLWGKEISCRAIRQDEIVNLEGRVERPRPRTTKALAMVTDIKAPKTTCWKTLSWKYKAKTDHQPTTVLEEDAEELENGIGKHPPAADAKDGEDEGNRFTTG